MLNKYLDEIEANKKANQIKTLQNVFDLAVLIIKEEENEKLLEHIYNLIKLLENNSVMQISIKKSFFKKNYNIYYEYEKFFIDSANISAEEFFNYFADYNSFIQKSKFCLFVKKHTNTYNVNMVLYDKEINLIISDINKLIEAKPLDFNLQKNKKGNRLEYKLHLEC